VNVAPVLLAHAPVRLEPLTHAHAAGLRAAAADGALWRLRVTSVPEPEATAAYIDQALAQQAQGTRLPFAICLSDTGEVVGSTSYHDIVADIDRLEIGYTWIAERWQRSAVNTTCKWLLMRHAFETLGAQLVGWRTDALNAVSQAAIERLGARRDGVLRHHHRRRDGSVRDTVMYSMTAAEWPAAQQALLQRLGQ